MLRYEFQALGAGCNVRVDVFNLFNNDAVNQVREYAEQRNLTPDPSYRMARFHQAPRSVRLGLGVSF